MRASTDELPREVADARRGGRSARDEARSHRCGDKARSHRYGEDTLAGYSDNAGTGRCGRSAWASHGDQRGAWRMGCGQCTPHVAVLFCSVPSRSRLGFWKAFPERVALRSDKTSRAVEVGTRMRRNRSTFHGPLARSGACVPFALRTACLDKVSHDVSVINLNKWRRVGRSISSNRIAILCAFGIPTSIMIMYNNCRVYNILLCRLCRGARPRGTRHAGARDARTHGRAAATRGALADSRFRVARSAVYG